MLKTRAVRLAVTAAMAFGAVAGTSGAAAHPDYSSCDKNGQSAICTNVTADVTLWSPSNNPIVTVPNGSQVAVSCYYTGQGAPNPDGFWDHIVWTSNLGNTWGHLSDNDVNFGGATPPSAGIPHC
jgi:hypothetical protein